MTDTLAKALDGRYTLMLRYCMGYTLKDKVTNAVLYGKLPRVSKRLLERKLRFAGHCQRATDQPVSDLLFWDHTKMSGGKCTKGAGARPYYAKRLLLECSCVVRSDTELANLMKDKEQWQRRNKMIVWSQPGRRCFCLLLPAAGCLHCFVVVPSPQQQQRVSSTRLGAQFIIAIPVPPLSVFHEIG
jgi:hypothetical protein